ncbi:MAG: hypothetical protein IMF19_14800 [Proteobacteria bacterium]|nr:hypothetical protein [Pseudomonadota bacterium]
MAVYTTDVDLVKKRANILTLGIAAFTDQHAETERIITRDLVVWYDAEARLRGRDPQGTPFDQAYLLESAAEVTPAAVLLALSLAYDLLSKDLPADSDGMAAQREHYRREFDREWGAAKLVGFTYDWDESGTTGIDESPQVRYRELLRQ